MTKSALLVCLCVFALQAQDISLQERPSPKLKKLWMWSLAALAAGNIADVQSSWRAPEANPILARSQGRFGWESLGIKLGLQVPLVGFELWQAHKHPSASFYKTYAVTNFAAGGAVGVVAVRNYRLRQPGSLH